MPLIEPPKDMSTEGERCASAKKFRRIDEAFRQGDLEGLRAAADDPTTVPNGPMPDGIRRVPGCWNPSRRYSPGAALVQQHVDGLAGLVQC